MLEDLINIGFKKAGSWFLVEGNLIVRFEDGSDSKNVLYCFVVSDEPVYVGKTIQKLKKRMYGYKNPGASQSTNIRNNKNLIDTLKAGEKVDLYVLPDNGLLHFGRFHLNLAAGLEDSIVKTISPRWNITGI